jgi:Na+/proline symporter
MSSTLILTCVLAYSALLFFVVWLTSRKADNESYFIGNRSSKWYVVAYGMIGASLSGVTFMSVPGWVGTTQFSYMMVVFGYFAGYMVVATILLPLYYRLHLTSIYSYLQTRFGFHSYKTGSLFFILSRTIGSALRLYIVINVLQTFVFDQWGISFWFTTAAFISMILLYTYKGGVKTIIWTDTLQTTFMLAALVLSIILIAKQLGFSASDVFQNVVNGDYSRMVITDVNAKNYFLKHFFGGMFITIAMTGLDQEMMQKNISVKTLAGSKKNMIWFSIVLVFINFLFLSLGVMLYLYSKSRNMAIPTLSDDLFPTIALGYLGTVSAVFFIIGLISAAYPSADGALTALTSSFCLDILGIRRNEKLDEEQRKKIRYIVHFSFAVLLFLVIGIFRIINDRAVIDKVLTIASYTYGPLLGLFAFGIFSKRMPSDRFVPVICILAPFICYWLNENSVMIFNGYKFGYELLIVNGFVTVLGLLAVSRKAATQPESGT